MVIHVLVGVCKIHDFDLSRLLRRLVTCVLAVRAIRRSDTVVDLVVARYSFLNPVSISTGFYISLRCRDWSQTWCNAVVPMWEGGSNVSSMLLIRRPTLWWSGEVNDRSIRASGMLVEPRAFCSMHPLLRNL